MGQAQPLPEEVRRKLRWLGESATDEQREFMEKLANRDRQPKNGETPVDDLAKPPKPEGKNRAAQVRARAEAVDFFNRLADAVGGTIIQGRHTKPTRLKWGDCSAIAAAKAFLGQEISAADSATTVNDEIGNDEISDTSVVSSAENTETRSYRHEFLLRADMKVAIELPLDVTKEEANRLAEFIKSIPF